LPLAVVAALVLSALAPVPAAAAPAHSSRHVALAKGANRAGAATQPAAALPPLTYSGGPVALRPRVYLVFWGKEWTDGSFSSAPLETYVHDFFSAIGGSAWLGSTGEYCQGVTVGATSCPFGWAPVPNPPGQLGGVWVDSTAVPPTPIDAPDDTEIWKAVHRAYVHFADAHAAYMVFTPPNHDPSNFGTGTNAICAWHDSNPNAGPAPYAVIPFLPDASSPSSPNSCGTHEVNATPRGYYDGFSIMAGHEYAEILTNPFPNTSTVAWADAAGQENADKCLWSTASPATNQPSGSQQFAVQSLWSNAAAGCVNDSAHAPPVGAGRGYSILTGFGGIYSFGNARYWGNLIDRGYPGQAVSLTEMPDGAGYSILTAPGGIYSFGDARYFGNLLDHGFPGPAVSLAETPDGGGYALLNSAGAVYNFGASQYFGNLLDHGYGGTPVALAYTPAGLGYYILTAQGAIYSFGDAPYMGNLIDHGYLGQAIGLAVTKDGLGYSILTTSGALYSFGDAPYLGNLLDHGYPGPAVAVSGTP
jgi:hypothetical protein